MGDLATFLLPNAPTCIVACSAAHARFWRSDSRFGAWRRINEMNDPAASQREAEFSSDRPGRSFNSVGKGRHAMSQPQTGQNHEKLIFARQIAKYLNQSIANSDFLHVALIAPPKFLGIVKTELSNTTLRAVVLEESKNLTDLNDAEIKRYFE
jgi:protein required for attachment to host cells